MLFRSAGEDPGGTQRQRAQRPCDRPDRQRLDFQGHLAWLAIFVDRRCMREPAIEGRDASRGVAHGTAFDQLRRQNQVVQRGGAGLGRGGCQWLASCAALRASSFSTDFIMTEGVVSPLSLATVRWRSTASL